MTDYRSPATTYSSYAKDDPTLNTTRDKDDPTSFTSATLPTSTTTTTTTAAPHHHHHHHGRHHSPAATSSTSSTTTVGVTGAGDAVGTERIVKTGEYPTGLDTTERYSDPVPVVGTSYQNRVAAAPGAAGPATAASAGPLRTQQPGSGDGLPVVTGIGGPLGGSVVLGGQCECLRDGGTCEHGADKCTCRGCTTAATTVNPGINIGVSTMQYTAPVGTTGLGGGVSEAGTAMSGVVNPTNIIGQPVTATAQNCECIKNAGVCRCPAGACTCTNCKGQRQSMQATRATPYTSSTTTTTSNMYQSADYTGGRPINPTNSNSGVI